MAHPGALRSGTSFTEDEIMSLINQGLDGIEVFYGEHTDEEFDYYLDIAERHDLIITGGTDYHGKHGFTSSRGGLTSELYAKFIEKSNDLIELRCYNK